MSSSEAPPAGPLVPGAALLDRYRAVEVIASGGHSVVYLGHDTRLDRPVCIKVFTRYPADAGITRTSYEHFVQEAFALSRLTHPNTLRIYDFGHLPGTAADPGLPFHVSEYMNGGTLAQRVREHGAQPTADAVRIATAIGEALAEAHLLGIIHRDLKPQNILFALVGGGRLPKLADFGIAKWHEVGDDDRREVPSRAGDTQVVSGHRMAMYSPSWAAPEQLAGQPIGPEADIYSLALLTVYMLTGRAVFADDDVYEGYRKRRSSDSIVGNALEPLGLPTALVAALRQSLAFEPGHRPSDAATFVQALTAAQSIAATSASLAVARASTELPTDEVTGLARATPRRPEPTPRLAPEPTPRPLEARLPIRNPPRHLSRTTDPVEVHGRAARFILTTDGTADIDGLGGRFRLRLSLVPTAGGFHLHVRGKNCFVAHHGARPSVAVQIDREAMLDLREPGGGVLGRVRISPGVLAVGHTVFRFGEESIAIAHADAPDVVLVDFGAGAECAFVHAAAVPGDPAARVGGKRGKT